MKFKATNMGRLLSAFLLFLFVFSLTDLSKQVRAFADSPVDIREELGCSPTLSAILGEDDAFFDPLNLATDDNFARYREAELKHGRVAMASFVEVIRGSVVTNSEANDSLFDISALTSILQHKQLPSIYQLFSTWTYGSFAAFVLLCGFLDTIVFVQRSSQDMPGDYGTGWFGIRDKGENERSLVCELENGRLAMIAMLYFLLHDIAREPFYATVWESFARLI